MFITKITLGDHHDDGWPFSMPPVRHLAAEGLTFERPVTFLVGENGSGKSTTVFEAMFAHPGLYLMDEPEAALSFSSCLRLVGVILDLAESGSQCRHLGAADGNARAASITFRDLMFAERARPVFPLMPGADIISHYGKFSTAIPDYPKVLRSAHDTITGT